MTVRGEIPYYGALGVAEAGPDLLTNPALEGMLDVDAPYFRGPELGGDLSLYTFYDPFRLSDPAVTGNAQVCPTLFFHGTNDFMVPPGWSIRLQNTLLERGHLAIGAYHPLGSHGYDALHWSQYGQSVLYYFERFLALTH
jgi:fermentation-respiration switch protein FrsA (DUF1100 family)